MSDWFESWFDTSYYHILYKNRDHNEARKFVELLAKKLEINPKAFILDLCCGKGRHAIHLNNLGFRVHGVDLSEKSIQYAKQFENDRLTFEIKDMRNHIESGPFDVVFNLFTSFGYFNNQQENEKVLLSVSKYLKKDGFLIIDFLNAVKVSKSLPVTEKIIADGIEFKVDKSLKDKTIYKEINFTDAGQEYTFSEQVQAFELSDLEKMLTNTGYVIKGIYGDYDLSAFNKEESPRLILKAKLI